ncbi:MAG TPA: glycosyltransferase family 2 protein [Acidimicrobiales bacterium]|nr:glycosyltransferase family 2 protein [Acidimicrobiales bacterium]
MSPFVRVVVLNFNGAPFVLRCVEALSHLDYPPDRHEIVVVDNASTDGSVDALRSSFPGVRLVEKAENTGFPANNVAMTDLDGVDHVALVNPDAFVEPDWLAKLVEAALTDPTVGAWCPKILLEPRFADLALDVDAQTVPGDPRLLGVQVSGVRVDGEDRFDSVGFGAGFWGAEVGGGPHPRYQWSTDHATLSVPLEADEHRPMVALRLRAPAPTRVRVDGGPPLGVGAEAEWFDVGSPTGPLHDIVNNIGSRLVDGGFGGDRGFLVPDQGQFDQPCDVFAWCGGGVLLSRDYLADVGLFDESFFLYYEDTDLSWRGLARGWRHRTVPDAVMRHLHAATSEEGSPLFQHFVERNRFAMLTKNAPGWMLRRAVVGYVRALTSYTLRDIVLPLTRGHRPSPGLPIRRARSFIAWLKMLPQLLPERRRLRRRQRVPDALITGWSEPQ